MAAKSDRSLLEVTHALPAGADKVRGQETLTDLRAALAGTDWQDVAETETFGDFAVSLAGNSPFIARTCLRYPALLPSIAKTPPSEAFEASLNEITVASEGAATFDELMAIVRRAKSEMAVRTAAADVTGLWSLEEVTGNLTRFADTVLEAGFAWVLQRAREKGDIVEDSVSPATSGLVVLAMGK